MIDIFLKGHDYRYEISEFLKLFTSQFSFEDTSEESDKVYNILDIQRKNDGIELKSSTEVYSEGKSIYENTEKDFISYDGYFREKKMRDIYLGTYVAGNECIGKILSEEEKDEYRKSVKILEAKVKTISKRIIERSMFGYLKSRFDANVPWGILTGIRPVKIIHTYMDEGKSEYDIRALMKKEFLISDEKLDLIIDIAKRERFFIYPLSKDRISLYVSIPFCPSRCLYCSFPSHSLDKYGDRRHEYVESVLKEADGVREIIDRFGKEIETLYIGGGTPTSLSSEDLAYLIDGLFEIFDFSALKEFTVEAGRPDTIDEEKLKTLKSRGVDRISINPQTMNDETLVKIGRKHTVSDIVNTFRLARKTGFDNINMDIILGLVDETPEMVENTMKKVIDLDPESVTVHTLALKRASTLKINIDDYKDNMTTYDQMTEMISVSRKYLVENGYNPYYMYRQKYMLGNLENTGYSKPGYECLYNMQIMEDRQSNYAIGAGAVSKFIYLDENRIERVDDVKNLEQYIDRVDEMIEKKFREVEKNEDNSSERD